MTALSEDLGFLLSRTSGLVVRATNVALESLGLRVRQYSVLALVADTDHGVSQRDLAETLGLDPSQVVILVDELAASGMVERRPAPHDRRAKLVAATAEGRRVRDQAAERAAAGVQEQLTALTDEEQKTLKHLLQRAVAPRAAPPRAPA